MNVGPSIAGPHFATVMDQTPHNFRLGSWEPYFHFGSDVGSGTMGLKIVAGYGVVTLHESPGITLIEGDGFADHTLWFRGTVSDINTALDGMTFAPLDGYQVPRT